MTNTNANNLDVLFQDLSQEEVASISGGAMGTVNVGPFTITTIPDAAIGSAFATSNVEGFNGNQASGFTQTTVSAADLGGGHHQVSTSSVSIGVAGV